MVSSTVYGSESDLDQIGGILDGYGYVSSHVQKWDNLRPNWRI